MFNFMSFYCLKIGKCLLGYMLAAMLISVLFVCLSVLWKLILFLFVCPLGLTVLRRNKISKNISMLHHCLAGVSYSKSLTLIDPDDLLPVRQTTTEGLHVVSLLHLATCCARRSTTARRFPCIAISSAEIQTCGSLKDSVQWSSTDIFSSNEAELWALTNIITLTIVFQRCEQQMNSSYEWTSEQFISAQQLQKKKKNCWHIYMPLVNSIMERHSTFAFCPFYFENLIHCSVMSIFFF